MNKPAVVYARYSTDLQREASIKDQTDACRRYASNSGYDVVSTYHDAAISGASVVNRPGLQQLMHDAKRKGFSAVIVHAIDRLGRRLADLADLHDELTHLGIKLYTPELGEITPMHIAICGMMAQDQLRNIGSKTKNGQIGRASSGKIPSGIAFGYRALPPKVIGKTIERGEREIVEAEAAIVRRIFQEFAGGKSPEAIARDLNSEGICGPGGREWLNTTIRGQKERGTGLLNNALYIGRLEWNRCSYVKNLRTGKREHRLNEAEVRVVIEVEHLRVIDDALWFRVKIRQEKIEAKRKAIATTTGNPLNGARRPQFLLSGKLECGCCGHGFTVVDRAHYGCARRRAAGTCTNDHKIRRDDLEARVLRGIKQSLLSEHLLAAFHQNVEAEIAKANKEQNGARKRQEAELAKAKKRIGNMVRAISDGGDFSSLKEELAGLESKRASLEAGLATPQIVAPTIDLPSNWVEAHRAEVERLEEALEDEATKESARTAIQSLIERIVLTPVADGSGLKIEMEGALAGLLALSAGQKAGRPRSFERGLQLSVVAGARFELTTFRL